MLQVDKAGRVWAIRQDSFKVKAKTVALSGQMPLAGSSGAMVVNGTAIVPVRGPLLREPIESDFGFSIANYAEIRRDIALALDDQSVTAIALDIDSPGGMVAGVADLAAFIRESRAIKPISAFIGGLGASAAYHLASATGRIVAERGAVIGSIGTVIEYVDFDPMFEAMGAKLVTIVAETSPNKRLDRDTDEGRAELQALVDHAGRQFIESVAAGRGISAEAVQETYGAGLVFHEAEALSRGMIDAVGTLGDLIREMADPDQSSGAVSATAQIPEHEMNWDQITAAALKENRPDLYAEIGKAAVAAVPAPEPAEPDPEVIAAAIKAGADDERARLEGLEAACPEGYDDLLTAAKADPKATDATLALQIVARQKAVGASAIEGMRADDAAANVPVAPVPAVEPSASADPETQWASDPKLRAEFGEDKEAFLAFARKAETGHARILQRA